jgi:hypothetical protein
MSRFLLSASLLLAAVVGTGCYAEETGYGNGGYAATAVVAGPNLVEVSPGVQVVADYDYPVFYTDGLYYRQTGGIWYSSRWHDHGWGVGYNVPYGIRGIQRPEGYAHFRGGVGYRGNAGYRGNGGYRGGEVRGGGGTYRGAPANRGTTVRSSPARSAPAHSAPAKKR